MLVYNVIKFYILHFSFHQVVYMSVFYTSLKIVIGILHFHGVRGVGKL